MTSIEGNANGAGSFLCALQRERLRREFADELEIARDPNKHLSFGQDIHFCLGAPLARLEAEIAINTLLRRIPDLHLRVAVGTLRWRPSMFLRGLESLPLSFGVLVD